MDDRTNKGKEPGRGEERVVPSKEEARQADERVVASKEEARRSEDRVVLSKDEARQGEVLGQPKGVRHDEPIVETREEARQGETWAPMQRVLFGGIALVVIAFLILYLVFAL